METQFPPSAMCPQVSSLGHEACFIHLHSVFLLKNSVSLAKGLFILLALSNHSFWVQLISVWRF